MPRNRLRAAKLFRSTYEAQVATWTTLGIRVPALLDGSASAAERSRMVREKAEAVAESAQAVGQAMVRLASRPGSRAITPAAALSGWLALAEAGSRPFHKRVKANAKRLSRTTRRPTSG